MDRISAVVHSSFQTCHHSELHSILWQWFNPRLGGRYIFRFFSWTILNKTEIRTRWRWILPELKLFFIFKFFRNQKINFIANKCLALIFFVEIMTMRMGFINKMRSLVVIVVVVSGMLVFLAGKRKPCYGNEMLK